MATKKKASTLLWALLLAFGLFAPASLQASHQTPEIRLSETLAELEVRTSQSDIVVPDRLGQSAVTAQNRAWVNYVPWWYDASDSTLAPKRGAWDSIDQFRRLKHGMDELGDTIPIRGDGLGTVAFVETGGRRVFGVNSRALVRDVDKNLGRMWREKLGFGPGQAQSLFHAEAHSLMRAYEKLGGKMPGEMTLFVDRLTCGPCKAALPDLVQAMGINKLTIQTKGGRVGEIVGGAFRWLE